MARVTSLEISGYRSIKDEIVIQFPSNAPLTLIGENNAGKSNIVRAMDLLLGEMWPSSKEPEDHDFWNRDSQNGCIQIEATFSDMYYVDRENNRVGVDRFVWKHDASTDGENPYFKAISEHGEERYVSNNMRDQCICVIIGADRRLSYQLSYTSKWTLLSKLMRKFHKRLAQDESRVERLKGKFEEIKQIFNEVDEFLEFQTKLSEKFGEMFQGMSYGLQIDFSAYDPSNFFHSLRVFPEESGHIRTFEELGTGQEQLLALAFAHAYAKAFYGGIVLVIEEPEAHLHPLAQQWLSKKITEMAHDGLQIVITTHSPAFIDLLNLDGIVLVKKGDGSTNVVQLDSRTLTEHCIRFGADPERAQTDTILPFYSSAATEEIVSGLFAKKVILVEGKTESMALPVYLEKVGFDTLREGVAIIPVFGKGNLAKWWRFFTAYQIPTYVIFDNDASHDRRSYKRRDFFRTMGITDEEEIEQLLNMDDWLITDRFSIFGRDFEETMRQSFQNYRELENEAISFLGDSKLIVARFVACNLEFNQGAFEWRKFNELASRITKLNSIPIDNDPNGNLKENDLTNEENNSNVPF